MFKAMARINEIIGGGLSISEDVAGVAILCIKAFTSCVASGSPQIRCPPYQRLGHYSLIRSRTGYDLCFRSNHLAHVRRRGGSLREPRARRTASIKAPLVAIRLKASVMPPTMTPSKEMRFTREELQGSKRPSLP